MSENKKPNTNPEPKPGEASAQQYMANSAVNAHLIADMLRIESISNEVKSLASILEKQEERAQARADRQDAAIEKLKQAQHEHATETTLRMNSHDDKIEKLAKEIKKIEGWIFAMIGITVTGLITVVVTLFSGVVG